MEEINEALDSNQKNRSDRVNVSFGTDRLTSAVLDKEPLNSCS